MTTTASNSTNWTNLRATTNKDSTIEYESAETGADLTLGFSAPHPRDDLTRSFDYYGVDSEMRAAGDDGKTLVGYPIVFDVWTEIGGWEGNFLESLSPTCVTKTLAERSGSVRCLWNHGFDPSIGDKPLGKPAIMKPDGRGLWTETPFIDRPYADDIRELVRTGTIDGMSFRFSVIKETWNDDPGTSDRNPKGIPERTIDELRLFEFGPVTFPAYEATTAGVRALPAYEAYRAAVAGNVKPTEPTTVTLPDKPTDGHLSQSQRQQAARRMRRLLDFEVTK